MARRAPKKRVAARRTPAADVEECPNCGATIGLEVDAIHVDEDLEFEPCSYYGRIPCAHCGKGCIYVVLDETPGFRDNDRGKCCRCGKGG